MHDRLCDLYRRFSCRGECQGPTPNALPLTYTSPSSLKAYNQSRLLTHTRSRSLCIHMKLFLSCISYQLCHHMTRSYRQQTMRCVLLKVARRLLRAYQKQSASSGTTTVSSHLTTTSDTKNATDGLPPLREPIYTALSRKTRLNTKKLGCKGPQPASTYMSLIESQAMKPLVVEPVPEPELDIEVLLQAKSSL